MRDGPRCFPPDSSCPAVLRYRLASGKVFAYGAVTLCGPAFQPVLLTSSFGAAPALLPRRCLATPTVWAPPLSLATTRGIIVILFSCRYLDVSVPCVRSLLRSVPGSLPAGSPIRTSAVRAGICPSPPLFAACHVLLRLREPRHPPYALLCFPFSFRLGALEISLARVTLDRGCLYFFGGGIRSFFALCLRLRFSMSMTFVVVPVVPGRVELPTSTLSV